MLLTSSAWRRRVVAAVSIALTALCLVLTGALPAAAHTELLNATPAAGERVKAAAPLTVSLTFTEAIDPALAHVVVVDAADQVVATGSTAVDGATVTLVTREVPESGKYVVRYRVVSADGHPVDGATPFSVVAPEPEPDDAPATSGADDVAASEPDATVAVETAEGAVASDVAPASADTDGGSGPTGLVVGAVAAVAVIALLAALFRRRAVRSGADGT